MLQVPAATLSSSAGTASSSLNQLDGLCQGRSISCNCNIAPEKLASCALVTFFMIFSLGLVIKASSENVSTNSLDPNKILIGFGALGILITTCCCVGAILKNHCPNNYENLP